MELIDFVRMLRRRWAWLALPVLLAWLAGVVLGFTTPKVYEATAQAFVSNNVEDAKSSEAQSGSQYVFDRMDSYALLVSTKAVAEGVIASLKLDMTPSTLSSHVKASVTPDTIVLRVTASDDDPKRAAAIANATVAELGKYIEQVETAKPGASSFVRVSIVGPASAPSLPGGSSPLVRVISFILVGFALGIGLASLRDQSLRSRAVSPTPERPAPGATAYAPERPAAGAVAVQPERFGRKVR